MLHTDPFLALNYTSAGQSVSKHNNQCKTYFLRQGCWNDGVCGGTTQVTVKKTVFPEVYTRSHEQQEALQVSMSLRLKGLFL